MDATPAKWKVFRVIWVPGSPMLWAQTAPTAVPGSILDLAYFSLQMVRNWASWDSVQRLIQFKTNNKWTGADFCNNLSWNKVATWRRIHAYLS